MTQGKATSQGPLFLILHKVRGEPAFDIAERCDEMGTASDPGPWWIIPTSGHRAYPFRWWGLGSMVCQDTIDTYNQDIVQPLVEFENGLPADWPDHYAPKPAPYPGLIDDLLSALGLAPGPKPDFKKRRIV